MRRLILVLTAMVAALVLASGAGNDGRDSEFLDSRGPVDGGPGADIVKGGPGNDTLFDGDNLRGKRDILYVGDGDDVLLSSNTVPTEDILHCGRGRDTVYGDRADIIANDCEKVFFRDAPPGSFYEL